MGAGIRVIRRGGAPVDFDHGRGPGSAATEDRDPAQPGTARPRHVGQAAVPDKDIVDRFYVPLVYTACRTCYSELEPQEIFRRAAAGEVASASMQKLIGNVIDPGTARPSSTSCSRSPSPACRGRCPTSSCATARASRSTSRASATSSTRARRRCCRRPSRRATPTSAAGTRSRSRGARPVWRAVGAGVPGEDARFVFPNATRTNLVMTTNLRALIHMSGLRLCTMAQWEIRRLFQLIRHEIFGVSPFLGSFLAPKCVALGYCDEFNNRDEHCPIRLHNNVRPPGRRSATKPKKAGRELPVT